MATFLYHILNVQVNYNKYISRIIIYNNNFLTKFYCTYAYHIIELIIYELFNINIQMYRYTTTM